jgi:hypothetical protein
MQRRLLVLVKTSQQFRGDAATTNRFPSRANDVSGEGSRRRRCETSPRCLRRLCWGKTRSLTTSTINLWTRECHRNAFRNGASDELHGSPIHFRPAMACWPILTADTSSRRYVGIVIYGLPQFRGIYGLPQFCFKQQCPSCLAKIQPHYIRGDGAKVNDKTTA